MNNAREKIIVIAPEASISLREWPYFKELIKELRKKYPEYQIKIVGNKNNALWDFNDVGVENLVGKTTLNDVKEICRKSSLVIGNDSGLVHIAATLADAPTIVLFGPGNPHYIKPLGSCVEVVRVTNLLCSPCESRVCKKTYGYKVCLNNLSVEEVINKGDSFLN
jgi:heptosyltransferase-2